MPGHVFAALHPAASPHRATGAASERRVGLVRRSQQPGGEACVPRLAIYEKPKNLHHKRR